MTSSLAPPVTGTDAAVDTVPSALPCPCGRAHPLVECCLPLAQTLRQGPSGQPSPFDEIRASNALLLWSLLATERRATSMTAALSRAAQAFWGPILAGLHGTTAEERGAGSLPADDNDGAFAPSVSLVRAALGRASRSPDIPPEDDGEEADVDSEAGAPSDSERMSVLGAGLFERIWGPVDAETRTWLHASLPSFVLADPLLGELALDWLLWDRPWVRRRPGAYWTARCGALRARPRVQNTTDAILGSRIGLWRLDEVVPRRGFRLTDRLTGDRTFLHTTSDPWPDADERLLLARVYAFGDWRLLGGRCLLFDPVAIDHLLHLLNLRAKAVGAPTPRDPRWRAWLKAELPPIAAAQWLATRLAPLPPDRYHGTHC